MNLIMKLYITGFNQELEFLDLNGTNAYEDSNTPHNNNRKNNTKSKFSFSWISCHIKAKEPSLPFYLPIDGGRIVGFIPFLRALAFCETLQ